MESDAAIDQGLGEKRTRARRVRGHQPALGHQAHRRLVAEAMADGECQLDATGAAADHGDRGRFGRLLDPRLQRFPMRGKEMDRLDRDRVLGGTGHGEVRRRADIQGDHVEADPRPAGEDHLAALAIEADRFGMDQAGAGEAGEGCEVDVALIQRVVPGDITRQHAGIGRLDLAGDQAEPDARHRPHAEGLEDMDMGVAAADQDEVADGLRHQKSTFGVSGT